MNDRMKPPLSESSRELGFAVGLVLGVALLALGTAFLVLGLSISTEPPAPYMSVRDRRFLIGGSLLSVVLGVVVIKYVKSLLGW